MAAATVTNGRDNERIQRIMGKALCRCEIVRKKLGRLTKETDLMEDPVMTKFRGWKFLIRKKSILQDLLILFIFFTYFHLSSITMLENFVLWA